MKFTVVWRPSAEAELASLWSSAEDRKAVASAANAIDARLRFDADSAGESRAGSMRILIVPPLLVYFRVRPEDRLVAILAVRRVRQRGSSDH